MLAVRSSPSCQVELGYDWTDLGYLRISINDSALEALLTWQEKDATTLLLQTRVHISFLITLNIFVCC